VICVRGSPPGGELEPVSARELEPVSPRVAAPPSACRASGHSIPSLPRPPRSGAVDSMTTAACPKRSSRHAAPDSASQAIRRSPGVAATRSAIGAATQKLRQWKQSISLPMGRVPSRARSRARRSAGPSSLARRWVTRQVARAARSNLAQNPVSLMASFGITDRPRSQCPVSSPFAPRYAGRRSLQMHTGKWWTI
jgi:hypothetical protein